MTPPQPDPHRTEPAAVETTTESIITPLLREELQVGKQVVDTGKGVRVHKTVTEREQSVEVPLAHDELVVERRPVGRIVDAANVPTAHYEGETLVVPVLEEVLVLQKQLRLTEEVRITRHRHETRTTQSATLRQEQVDVERFDETVGVD